MKYSAKEKPVLISKLSFGCLCIVHWLCSQDLNQTQGKFTSRITKMIHDFLDETLVPGGDSVGPFLTQSSTDLDSESSP